MKWVILASTIRYSCFDIMVTYFVGLDMFGCSRHREHRGRFLKMKMSLMMQQMIFSPNKMIPTMTSPAY